MGNFTHDNQADKIENALLSADKGLGLDTPPDAIKYSPEAEFIEAVWYTVWWTARWGKRYLNIILSKI